MLRWLKHKVGRFVRRHANRFGFRLSKVWGVPDLLGLPTGFRFHKKDPLVELMAPCSRARTAVYELAPAKLRGVGGHFEVVVLDRNGRMVVDLSPDVSVFCEHRVFAEPTMQKPISVPHSAICLATPGAKANYFHWLIDLLPKFSQLERAGITSLDGFEVFLGHSGMLFQKETLGFFGVDLERVRNITPASYYKVDKLVMPSHRLNHLEVPRWAVDFLKRRLRPMGVSRRGPQRLYVDRGNAARRKLLNGDEVRAWFERRGFTVVDLAGLAVREQIQLFRDADVIAGVHGAGFSNIVFCEPGTRLVEFFSPSYQPDYFKNIAGHVGVQWEAVVGEVVSRADLCGNRSLLSLEEPFILPLECLRELTAFVSTRSKN